MVPGPHAELVLNREARKLGAVDQPRQALAASGFESVPYALATSPCG
jgi:hypothetical protein